MNRHFLRSGIVALMTCVMFTSCKKADVTATAADPQLTFALAPDNPVVTFAASKTTTDNGTVVTQATTKAAFSWSAGVANITRFRLNAKRGDVTAEYTANGLTNVDLFSLSGLLSSVSIPKGDYSGVKVAVVFQAVVSAPYPMVLNGTYTTDGGVAYPVEFDLNDNVEISITTPNFAADGTKDFTANIAMHLNTFMTGIAAADLSNATKAPNTNLILINKTTNIPLYTKIKANMLACSAVTLANKPK